MCEIDFMFVSAFGSFHMEHQKNSTKQKQTNKHLYYHTCFINSCVQMQCDDRFLSPSPSADGLWFCLFFPDVRASDSDQRLWPGRLWDRRGPGLRRNARARHARKVSTQQ